MTASILHLKSRSAASILLVILLALGSTGCAHFSWYQARYAEVYVRALDSDAYSDVGAKIYLGDSGQVLTTELTPTAVRLERKNGWYPGEIVHIVLDAPGYRTAVHLVKLTRWAATPMDAPLNANNVDVMMVRD